ncbi:MAG: M15 family metallopeptidase [bacterium]
MEHKDSKNFWRSIIPAGIVFLILGGFIGFEAMQISKLTKNLDFLSIELSSTTAALSQNTQELSQNITNLRAQGIGLSNTLSSTQQNIEAVTTQVNGVKQNIGSISGAVGTLQKLAQIDPELLKKYSKVYFLNENYTPAHLTSIPSDYLYNSSSSEQFITEAWPHLKNLLDTAKNDGMTLYIKSAYRSFAEQKSLKSLYTVVYGAGTANSFSANQGYSEHQLGTTLDFITKGLGGKVDGFEKTNVYQWLLANAHRFGFELSFPKGNNYYVHEPWHWRFVGVKLATHLHDNKINFYDMDQREIDTYLVNIFD